MKPSAEMLSAIVEPSRFASCFVVRCFDDRLLNERADFDLAFQRRPGPLVGPVEHRADRLAAHLLGGRLAGGDGRRDGGLRAGDLQHDAVEVVRLGLQHAHAGRLVHRVERDHRRREAGHFEDAEGVVHGWSSERGNDGRWLHQYSLPDLLRRLTEPLDFGRFCPSSVCPNRRRINEFTSHCSRIAN